ncbi:MAG: urease accessory protein [Gammaproteobacteria bacterium]|jgi:urease accessory protein
MNYSIDKQTSFGRAPGRLITTVTGLIVLLCAAGPVLAHHPLGGRAPTDLFEGIVSGFAHPIIGIDHLAFLLAIGLLAVGQSRRYWIPAAFVVATVAGTVVHLRGMNLFSVEAMIAISVVLSGGLLVAYRQYRPSLLIALGGVAGLFHGYAYGEAIVGAESTPLFAYLVGFSVIQYVVMATSIWAGGRLLQRVSEQTSQTLVRVVGSAITAVGLVFFALTFG